MVKHSATGFRFPFSVRVLYLDEICKTIRVNATQVVNITVLSRPLRHQLPPACAGSFWNAQYKCACQRLLALQ